MPSKFALDSVALFKLANDTLKLGTDDVLVPLSIISVNYPYKKPASASDAGSNIFVNTESETPEVYMAYKVASGLTLSSSSSSSSPSKLQITGSPDGGVTQDASVNLFNTTSTSLFTFSSAATPTPTLADAAGNGVISDSSGLINDPFVVYANDSGNFKVLNPNTATGGVVIFVLNVANFEINATQLWLYDGLAGTDGTPTNTNTQVLDSTVNINNTNNKYEWLLGENTEVSGTDFNIEFKNVLNGSNHDHIVNINTHGSGKVKVRQNNDSKLNGSYLALGNESGSYDLKHKITNLVSEYVSMRNALTASAAETALDTALAQSFSFDLDRARSRIMEQFDEEVLSVNLVKIHQTLENKVNTKLSSSSTALSTLKTKANEFKNYYDHIGNGDHNSANDKESVETIWRAIQAFGVQPTKLNNTIKNMADNFDNNVLGGEHALPALQSDITKYNKQTASLLSLAKAQRHMSKRVGDENGSQFVSLVKDVNKFLRSTLHQFEGDIVRKQRMLQLMVHDLTRLQQKLNFSTSQYNQSAGNMKQYFDSIANTH